MLKNRLFLVAVAGAMLSSAFAQETLDVGVVRIIAPTSAWVDSGMVVTPQAMVRNFGNLTASFPVIFRIDTFYTDTQDVVNLNPLDSTVVSFTDWLALQRGTHTTKCSTALAGDINPANDARAGQARVRVRDVGVTQIVAPVGIVDSGATITPRVRVANYGTGMATFSVTLRIGDSYTQTRNKTLFAGVTDTANFPAWTANELGTHPVFCSTAYTGDVNPANDTLSDSVTVVPVVGVAKKNDQLVPRVFILENSLPNPFIFRTIIHYGLPQGCQVNLQIYDPSGTLIRTLKAGTEKPGFYTAIWDGSDNEGKKIGKGIYFCRFKAGEFTATKKIVKME